MTLENDTSVSGESLGHEYLSLHFSYRTRITQLLLKIQMIDVFTPKGEIYIKMKL